MSTDDTGGVWGQRLRLAGVLLAIGFVVAGVTFIASPSLARQFAVGLTPNVLIAVAAMVMGLWVARTRWSGGVLRATEVPDVEFRVETPSPGSDFDGTLVDLVRYRQGTIENRERIKNRLATAAAGAIRNREDCTEGEAVEQLKQGSWTDNDVAAAFFTQESTLSSRSIVGDILDGVVGSDDDTVDYESRVEQVVDEIAAVANVERARSDGTADAGGDAAKREEKSAVPQSALTDHRDEGRRVTESMTVWDQLKTGRWVGASAFTLFSAGLAILLYQPTMLLISTVGIGYAVYASYGGTPPIDGLVVERSLGKARPEPGEEVDVTVTVENESGAFLTDIRVVDRVPASLTVIDGSPRSALSMQDGQAVSFTYTVLAERGEHTWPTQIIARNTSGSTEVDATVETDAKLSCIPSLTSINEAPVRSQTSLYSGDVSTDIGGSGLEFHQIREYQFGDPMRRIDWNHQAKTGDLKTINYREERAAKIVLLFDARTSAYVSPSPGARHAVDLAVGAATDVFASLYDSGNLVGLAAYDTVPCWLGPNSGDEHLERARNLFTTHPAISPEPPELKDETGTFVDPMTHVRKRMPASTQVFLFSPLGDDYTVKVARQLDSAGHRVTLLSPDPTVDRTVGQRLARVERMIRVHTLRKHGIRVINWNPTEQLGLELRRARQRSAVA